jgi:hypothetical protein
VTPASPEPSLTVNEPSKRAVLSAEDQADANAQVSAMIGLARQPTYLNRDKIPEQFLPFADMFHELTGLEPTRRVLNDWLAEFSVWLSEGIRPEHVRRAHQEAAGRFDVLRPGSLTRMAAAIRARRTASPRRSRDPEMHDRAVTILQQNLAGGRRLAAESYKSMGMPFEDPESIRPLISDLPKLMGDTQAEEMRPSAAMRDAIREKISTLIRTKSMPTEK